MTKQHELYKYLCNHWALRHFIAFLLPWYTSLSSLYPAIDTKKTSNPSINPTESKTICLQRNLTKGRSQTGAIKIILSCHINSAVRYEEGKKHSRHSFATLWPKKKTKNEKQNKPSWHDEDSTAGHGQSLCHTQWVLQVNKYIILLCLMSKTHILVYDGVTAEIVIVVFGLGNRTSVLQQPLHSKGLLMFIKRCIHRYDKAIIRFVTDNRLIALLMFNSLILTCYKSFGNNL